VRVPEPICLIASQPVRGGTGGQRGLGESEHDVLFDDAELVVLSSRTNELIRVTPSWAGRVKLRGGPPG